MLARADSDNGDEKSTEIGDGVWLETSGNNFPEPMFTLGLEG